MTKEEAHEIVTNKFTIQDAVTAPPTFNEDFTVNGEFVDYCKSKGYLQEH